MKEYNKNELLYVWEDEDEENGIFVLYQKTYKGTKDLSWHGSPWYEIFISCKRLDSDEIVDFGNQTYEWCSAKKYINDLQNKLKNIKDLANY